MKLVRNEQSVNAPSMRRESDINYPTLPAQPTRIEWRRDATLAPDLRPMFNAAVASLASFAAFMSIALATSARGVLVYVYVGIGIASITFLFYFTGLLWAQARLGIREYTSETPVVPETGRALRVMAADPDNPRSHTVAKYAMSDGEMTRLATALALNGWKMDRDTIRAAGVLPTADMSRWGDVVLPEFQRAELIDDERKVTRRGRALFEPYVNLPTPPARFEASYNPPPVRRQSTGDARGMGGSGAGGEE